MKVRDGMFPHQYRWTIARRIYINAIWGAPTAWVWFRNQADPGAQNDWYTARFGWLSLFVYVYNGPNP